MQTRGAIVRQAPGKYEVVDLEVDDPRPGEVQVKLVASGLCHSDDHVATGDIPVGVYPFAGGHEGAGIVTAAPPNHKGIKEGDHVVFSFLPSCGHCRWCASGQQNLCDLGAGLLAGSRWEDPTDFRLKLAGTDTPVGQMCGISTFVETTTVSADSVVKVDSDLPLDKVCLLGCNVGTGWGAAVNSAQVQPGHTVIVMGIGGVGINAVQGAAHAGAANIIAVDPVALKRENATQLGATHGVETMEEATELAKQFTNGQGADSAIITVGVIKPEYVGQAMASIRKAGTVVVTALGNIADTTGLPVSLADITLFQKRIQGSLFGESNPNWDILRQVELYRAGVLKLDEVITTTYSLDQIGTGYEAMHAGTNQKGVIVYS
ncbi:NDMA-dependent alcohol dehydrogenase [Pseudonocardia petroleophila]|uniref:NDMA-dependent alcohol dehydrogenase n=1 Tax=Pseudonocardia petroleophila TaxID=37331 RepID=A0A7G7MJI0_9PSEU|nr:NDMA-dependent alcohol dehydrogenase [Pseudonocardia petroleophila]QNG52941.1 NDMA-dependent alcohol dehydrogenase [Pseudonocardia petroleophila]